MVVAVDVVVDVVVVVVVVVVRSLCVLAKNFKSQRRMIACCEIYYSPAICFAQD